MLVQDEEGLRASYSAPASQSGTLRLAPRRQDLIARFRCDRAPCRGNRVAVRT